jgi:hypothetical protein
MIGPLLCRRTPIRHGSRPAIQHDAPVQVRLAVRVLSVTSALLIVGCTANQASPSPADVPGDDVSELCPEVDLRTPDGERLALTGTWRGDDFGEYYLAQRESCLHWLGMSSALAEFGSDSGAQAGDLWTEVFVGQIGSDFRVHGEFSEVPYRIDDASWEPYSAELVLSVGFFDDDQGQEWPTLHFVEQRGGEGYGGRHWVPVGAMPPRAEYVGAYRFEAGCPSIELNGQRYELVQWLYDNAQDGQLLSDGQVVARPGDQMRIDGQIWPDPDTGGCLPIMLLAWFLEPSP